MRFTLRRRDFVASTGLILTTPSHVGARATLKIGWLTVSPHPFIADFRERMRQLGYIEGANLTIEYRYANGDAALLPEKAEELVKAGVNIIVTSGSGATDAAVAVSRGIPVVFVTSDPKILGRDATLAQPGGIATGISLLTVDMGPKKVELIRDAVPALKRLAIFHDESSGGIRQASLMAESAAGIGIENRIVALGVPSRFTRSLSEVKEEQWQAAAFVASPLFAANAQALATLTVTHRLPALFDNPSFVRAGALMSYGPDLPAAFRRQAELEHFP